MPTYCYSNEDGSGIIDKTFVSFKEKDEHELLEKDGRKYIIVDGEKYYRNYGAEKSNLITFPSNWPMESTACAVLPNQREEAMGAARKNGVPTEFTKGKYSCSPIFRDRKHRKEYLKTRNFIDHDAGYGD